MDQFWCFTTQINFGYCTYTLENPLNNKLGASTSGAGAAGPYTEEPGMLGYNEICEFIKTGSWTQVWDDKQKVPYAYRGDQWIGFDNPKSVGIKTKYAIDNKLGGVMFWSLGTDDSKNLCGQGKFPILQSINSIINAQRKYFIIFFLILHTYLHIFFFIYLQFRF